jgi:hypothetical protein
MPIVPIDPRPELAEALLRQLEGQIQPLAYPVPTVRYFVTNVASVVEFYTRYLGFEVNSTNGSCHALPGRLASPAQPADRGARVA